MPKFLKKIDMGGNNIINCPSVDGNSATATKLKNTRTINGINFDGSTNINNYASTSGTSTAYTCTITGITSYIDGLEVTILPHIDCGSSPTLKINSLGALTIKNSSGETLKAGDIKSGVPISLVRVGSYFFIRGGGGKAKPNIFVQTAEPTMKDGIWIKKDATYDGVITLSNQAYFDSGVGYASTTNLPFDFSNGAAVAIGTDIYLFSGKTDRLAYKYNTITKTYTQLADIPSAISSFTYGSAVAVGTNIYLFGGYNSSSWGEYYKYDTVANTYNSISNLNSTYYAIGSEAVAVGTDIYLYSSSNGNAEKKAYKYSTIWGTYTSLSNLPFSGFYSGGGVVVIGTDIYLLYGNYNYKYNTTNGQYGGYTQLAYIPYNFNKGSAVVVGGDICLLSENNFYKYIVATDTYTKLTNIPYTFTYGVAILVSDYIYLLGGTNSLRAKYTYGAFVFSPNKIALKVNAYSTTYAVNLYKTDYSVIDNLHKFKFDDIFLTGSDGKNTNALCYYGTGTAWVQI